MSTQALEEQYVAKAKKAYNDQNLKLCLVYFKKVSTWKIEYTNVLVDSAYRLWKSNLEQGNEENETLELVQQAFTQLLSGAIPFELIQAWDYIRLSHIYLVEGNLHGALEILNLASNRGHLEDVLIVTQTWTIIKRLEMKKRDVTERINFLVSAVTLLAAEAKGSGLDSVIYVENSPLPLCYLYLHCTNQVYNVTKLRPKNIKQKEARIQQFKSMLIEAYYLFSGNKEFDHEVLLKWFLDPNLWNEMGKMLENTPFLLLIEECYWQAYLRRPLENIDLEDIVTQMKKYNRQDFIPSFLREAIVICQWNTYCRNSLMNYEKQLQKDETLHEWNKLFDSEEKELVKIQSRYRGYLLRKHWPEKSLYYIELRKNFLDKMALSYEYYGYALNRYYRSLIYKWKEFVIEWKELTKISSTLIQKHFRRYRQQKIYAYQLWKVQLANSKYLHLYRINSIWNKRNHLQAWYQIFIDYKRISAVKVITDVLFLNGYNQLLVKGMTLINSIIRIHKKHLKKQIIHHWFLRYLIRRKKHARNTIRFFIRFILRRVEEKKQDEQLKVIENVIKSKLDVKFQQNRSYIIKPFWSKWRKIYLSLIRYRKLLTAISTLQRQYLLKKSKKIVHSLKIRRINQSAWIKYHNHSLLLSIIRPWYYNGAAFRITRFFLNCIAWKKYRRIFEIHKILKRRIYSLNLDIQEKFIKKWKKFRYLMKRIKLRAIKRIQKFFRFCLFKKKLTHKISKRYFYYQFIWKYCYDLLLWKWFHYFKLRTKQKRQYLAIMKWNGTLTNYLLKNSFEQFKHQIQQQNILQSIMKNFYQKKWNQMYWQNSFQSVKILKTISFLTSSAENHGNNNENNHENNIKNNEKIDIKSNELVPWEEIIPKNKILYSLSTLRLYKIFHYWMIQYRLKKREIRFHSFLTSFDFYDSLIFRLKKRKQFIITLQSTFRRALVKSIYQKKKDFSLKVSEIINKHYYLQLKHYYQQMKIIVQKRNSSRLILQCSFRTYLAKCDYSQYLMKKEFYDEMTNYLNSSLFYRKTLMKKVFHQMICKYLLIFQENIRNDSFIIHKERLKKSRNQFLQSSSSMMKQNHQNYKNKKKSIKTNRNGKNVHKKKNKNAKNSPWNDMAEGEDEESSSDEDEGSSYYSRNNNRAGGSLEDEEDDEEEDQLDNFDDDQEDDSAMARLNLIQQYHQKLQQRQQQQQQQQPRSSSQNKLFPHLSQSDSNLNSSVSSSSSLSLSTATPSAHHLAQIKELRRKKLQQKKNIYEIRQRKQLLHEKINPSSSFQSQSSSILSPLSPNHSKLPSQGLLYFQSQSFHQLYYQLKEQHSLSLDEIYLYQLYPQELFYLLQQSNVLIISNLKKKHFHYLIQAYNGKKLIFLNSFLKEKYFMKYLQQELLSNKRLSYEKIPFEKQRWPFTLPHHLLEEEEEEMKEKIARNQLPLQSSRLVDPQSMMIQDIIRKGNAPGIKKAWGNTIIPVPEANLILPVGKDERILPKFRLLQLELNEVTMSIYTIMRFCRLIVRMIDNKLAYFTTPTTQVAPTTATAPIITKEEGEEDIESSIMITEWKSPPSQLVHSSSTADEYQEMKKIYQKVIYYGIESLSIDVGSFGLLGFLLLITSLQHCANLKSLAIHAEATAQQSSSCHELYGFAFDALGNNSSLQDLRYHGVWNDNFLQQMITILGNDSKFVGLTKLTLQVAKSSIPLTEQLIQIGKNRAYSLYGKGISMTIDVIDES